MIIKETKKKRRTCFFLALFVVFHACIFSLSTDSFVNLRYLEKEAKTSLDYRWEVDEIIISKNGKEIKIFLNIPYIISDECQKKIDVPPFSENGVIYVSQYTYDQMIDMLETETKKRSVEITPSPVRQQQEETAIKEEKKVEVKQQEKPAAKEATSVLKQKIMPTIAATASPVKNQVKILVLDPGHGGNDPGAIGSNGVREKDVVLNIALRVEKYLRKDNFRIHLTRDDDTFIPLKRRAVFANEKEADLFISIHCNASKNKGAQGVRTYIYDRIASSKEAAEAAKLENKNAGTLEMLLNDLRKGAFEYLSIEAAGNVQHCLVKNLKLKWEPTERAPFYVLANTSMPSVLVEAAFISNPLEEKKLDDDEFQEKIAKGIADGIMDYFSKLK
jgi:N-acetylmuramoyl-L-alanine amidase